VTDRTSRSLAVIIPTRGLGGLLQSCLWALQTALAHQRVYSAARVVVVDNASPKPFSLDELSGVSEIVRFDSHHSFSACVNQAASRHPESDLLLLNNDCFVHPDVIHKMAECFDEETIGIVGARLVFPDGSLQHGGVAQYPDGSRHVPQRIVPDSRPPTTYPTSVTGALMLIRRQPFDQVGGFDERYDFGHEDIDFCHRVRAVGWRIACEQSVESLHFESATPGRIERDKPSYQTYRSVWSDRVTHEFGGH